jgi:RNA polymerase sigma factor (sigma-70 family)
MSLTAIRKSGILLNREEQESLHKEGTPEARERLVLSLVGWALKQASNYSGYYGGDINYEEAASYCLQGIVEGVDSWEPKRGSLTTIATFHIRKRVLEAIAENRLIRLNPNVYWEGNRTRIGMREETILKAERAKHIRALRLDTAQDQNKNKFNDEAILLKQWRDQNESMRKTLKAQRELAEILQDCKGCLKPRELFILQEVGEGKTLKEIGEGLKITRERVRQIRNVALGKVQEQLLI